MEERGGRCGQVEARAPRRRRVVQLKGDENRVGQRERCHCTVVAREASGPLTGRMPSAQMGLTTFAQGNLGLHSPLLLSCWLCPLEGSTALYRQTGVMMSWSQPVPQDLLASGPGTLSLQKACSLCLLTALHSHFSKV